MSTGNKDSEYLEWLCDYKKNHERFCAQPLSEMTQVAMKAAWKASRSVEIELPHEFCDGRISYKDAVAAVEAAGFRVKP